MELLPHNVTDADLIAFADRWAMLMESEHYAAAYALTEPDPHMKWTPALLGEVVQAYGDASPGQKVTFHGEPTDIVQRKSVHRWERNAYNAVGQIWYDLNIDGLASDLTATFTIIQRPSGLAIELDDIHVM